MIPYDKIADYLIANHLITPGAGGVVDEAIFHSKCTTMNDIQQRFSGDDINPRLVADALVRRGHALVTPRGIGDEYLFAVISVSDAQLNNVTGRNGETLE